jgi:hypothetical protein
VTSGVTLDSAGMRAAREAWQDVVREEWELEERLRRCHCARPLPARCYLAAWQCARCLRPIVE